MASAPRDLWQHPRYADKAKVIERSTGIADLEEGVRIASSILLSLERARHVSGRPSMVRRNAIAIETVRALLERGEREGVFRTGINPWHLHLLIGAFCFLRVSNRYTWNAVFAMDLWEKNDALLQRELIVEVVLRYVRAD